MKRLDSNRLLAAGAPRQFALFLLTWIILAGTDLDRLLVGVPACAAAMWVNWRIRRASDGDGLALPALLRYVPGFLWRSLKGGVDVTWRVFHPALPVNPAFIRHRYQINDEEGRIVFSDALSLMPGTLPARIEGSEMIVHLLTDEEPVRREVNAEEARVRRILRSNAANPS